MASYNTCNDSIAINAKIVSDRKKAVKVLHEQIIDDLMNYAGLGKRDAFAALDSAIHYPHEDSILEYDPSTDMAKMYYSSAGDETITYQIVKI